MAFGALPTALIVTDVKVSGLRQARSAGGDVVCLQGKVHAFHVGLGQHALLGKHRVIFGTSSKRCFALDDDTRGSSYVFHCATMSCLFLIAFVVRCCSHARRRSFFAVRLDAHTPQLAWLDWLSGMRVVQRARRQGSSVHLTSCYVKDADAILEAAGKAWDA